MNNRIALFKGTGNESDPYFQILKNNDLCVSIIPVLEFNYCNEESLVNNLLRPNDFTGMILTSPRAVEAIHKSIHLKGLCLSSWKDKNNYSIGKSTSNLARNLLDLNTIGDETGCGEKLCDYILSGSDSSSVFLFPCSNIRKDTIPNALSEHGMTIVEVFCYETVANTSLRIFWEKLVSEQGVPDILIYFSPSGVQFSLDVIQPAYKDVKPKYIALGPVTAQALIESQISPAVVCNESTPKSLLNAVKHVIDMTEMTSA